MADRGPKIDGAYHDEEGNIFTIDLSGPKAKEIYQAIVQADCTHDDQEITSNAGEPLQATCPDCGLVTTAPH